MAVTQARLRELFDYDPETGVFTNRVRRANRAAGEVAGGLNALGYVTVAVDGKRYLAHRLAWLYVYGEMPKQIDHINCNRADNRIANLRKCDQKQNTQNIRRAHFDNRTGRLGVEKIPATGKYRARICVAGKATHIGCFPTAEEAHSAYLAAKSQLHPFSTLSA